MTRPVLDGADRHRGGGGDQRIALPTGGGASDWALQLRDVDLARIQSSLRPTRLSGTLAATVTGARQSVRGDLREDARRLDFAAVVEGGRVRVEHFRARAGGGALAGQGHLGRAHAFSVNARARGFDPSMFADVPPAKLTGTIDASGTLAPAWEVAGSATLDAGSRFADTTVSGKARGHATPQRASDLDVDLRAAGASIAEGAWGAPTAFDSWSMRFARRPAAGMLRCCRSGPTRCGRDQARRTLSARRAIQASFSTPGEGAAMGHDAAGGDARRREDRPGRRPCRTTGASADHGERHRPGAPRTELESARIEVGGTLPATTARSRSPARNSPSRAGFDGGLADAGLPKASTARPGQAIASLESTGAVPLVLESPASLVVSRSRVAIGAARIAIAEGHAEIDRFSVDVGRVDTRGSFRGVPVSALARLAGSPLPFASTLVVGGDWSIAAARRTARSALRESGDGRRGAPGSRPPARRWDHRARGHRPVVDDALDARLRVRTSSGSTADASFALDAGAVPGSLSSTAAMHATLRADMPTLQPLQPLLGTTAVIDGRLRADIEARGTLARPAFRYAHRGRAALRLPQHGAAAGRLRARLVGAASLDELSLRGGDRRRRGNATPATQ
jgi:translocation and assembly module TamB